MNNYTQQDYERDCKIIANAPEGATHYEDEFYLKADNTPFSTYEDGDWCAYYIPSSPQSLDQMRTNIALWEKAEKELGETQLLLIEEQERNQHLVQRIAELEEALEPDLFWPDGDTEMGFDSIYELFDYYIDQSSGVGMRISVERAAKLTNATYELIKIDDDCSIEVAEVKDE